MHRYDAAVLRRAAAPVGLVTLVSVTVAALRTGASGAGAALTAAGLVSAVFGLTSWLCSRTRSVPPATAAAVAVSGYLLTVVVLGLALTLDDRTPLRDDAFPVVLIAVTLVWMLAEVRAVGLLRAPLLEPEGWPSVGGRSAP